MLDRHHVTNNIDQVFSPHHNAGDIFDKVIYIAFLLEHFMSNFF
jgi:hypothetical protein